MNPRIAHPSLDMQRYAECFAVFMRYSLEYEQMAAAIADSVKAFSPHYAMLDVGAGTGRVIEALARGSKRPPERYLAFEPNPLHFAQLEERVRMLGLKDATLMLEFFGEATPLEASFDLILFSHSLYWMKDPAAVVAHCTEFLKPGGRVLSILQAPHGIHPLLALFEPRLGRSTPILQNNALSSYELVLGLRALGFRPEVTLLPTPLDVTGLFEPEKWQDLSDLLSFCLQIEFSALDADLQSDLLQYLRGACIAVNGRQLWPIPNAVVMLARPEG